MDAQVTARSQTYRLHQQASDAEIRHGQEVRADVPHVRVTATLEGGEWVRGPRTGRPERGQIFFCNMGHLRVREVLDAGDGGPLPPSVVVENLNVPDAGTYDLLNVLVRSNGDLRLVIDEKTEIVPVAEPETTTGWF